MVPGRRQAWLWALCVFAAWLAVGADQEEVGVSWDGARDYAGLNLETGSDSDLGEGMEVDDSAGRADYSKHPKVPAYLKVSRKLVTASWLRCKLACDEDKSCSGFKFTPMVKKQLPLCEILATAGGEFIKGREDQAVNSTELVAREKQADENAAELARGETESKESILRKYRKAKELVKKAEDTHARVASYAKDMQSQLIGIQKQIHAGKDQIIAMRNKETAAKKRVVSAHAVVKKAKIEVAALENQEVTEAGRKAQELSSKSEGKAASDIENAEKNAMDAISARAKHVGREEQSFSETVTDVSAKELLVKHLCAKNYAVLELKKKVIKAQLELKYKDNPEELVRQKEKVDKSLAAEKEKLYSSESVAKNFEKSQQKAKMRVKKDEERTQKLNKGLNGTDLIGKTELAELETDAKGYKKDHRALAVDTAQLTKYRKKLRELEMKQDEANIRAEKAVADEKKTKIESKEKLKKEKWKATMAAAGNRKTLIMLHTTLTNRRKSLEKDILRLKTQVALNKDSRTELLAEWSRLGLEETHLKHEMALLERVRAKVVELHQGYLDRLNKIKSYGGAVWLKKHNVAVAVAKFRHDVMALGTYTDTVIKTSNEKEQDEVVKHLFTMDKRRQEVLDDISKQSARKAHQIIEDALRSDKAQIKKITDPSALVKAYFKFKSKKLALQKEVNALKANAPTFNDLVAGEFHAVSQYTDRRAVVRMMDRLNKQLKMAMNSTAVEKRTSVLQVAHATARLYAHQVAHATHEKYLDFKLGRLDKRMVRVKNDIRKLKSKQALDKPQGPDEYDHLLDDEVKPKKTGSSVAEFKAKGNSWLNPEPIATPAAVTSEMRGNLKAALKKEFMAIAKAPAGEEVQELGEE